MSYRHNKHSRVSSSGRLHKYPHSTIKTQTEKRNMKRDFWQLYCKLSLRISWSSTLMHQHKKQQQDEILTRPWTWTYTLYYRTYIGLCVNKLFLQLFFKPNSIYLMVQSERNRAFDFKCSLVPSYHAIFGIKCTTLNAFQTCIMPWVSLKETASQGPWKLLPPSGHTWNVFIPHLSEGSSWGQYFTTACEVAVCKALITPAV